MKFFQPASWPGCCKACRQSSILMLSRVLVLMLMTSTSTGNLVLVLTSTRVDLFHQIFRPSCCIFALLTLLNQPTIVLLYPCLKIRSSVYQVFKVVYWVLDDTDLLSKHSRLGFILTPTCPLLLQLPHRSCTLSPL